MQSLYAQQVSSAALSMLDRKADWQVHSIFHRTFNITDGDRVVTITEIPSKELPNGVCVSLPGRSGFERFHLEARNEVLYQDGHLIFPFAGLAIDLSGAIIYPSDKCISESLLEGEELIRRLSMVHNIACMVAPQEGLAPLWYKTGEILKGINISKSETPIIQQMAIIALIDLLDGVRLKDSERIKRSAEAMAGLGIGLTPSGDDILTGFCAMLVLWGDATHKSRPIKSLLESIWEGAEGKTNPIGLNYLRQAMCSEISRVLHDFIRCLIVSEHLDLSHSTQELFAYGATSGSELGLGAYLGAVVSMEYAKSMPQDLEKIHVC
jgi:hypothetical protein